jgi:AcrR family transcriptional regulator
MPKVSIQRLADRRTQIVEAAMVCFARKGIHGTTMQEIFAQAQMSAGGVYRYFTSKDLIIAAIADDVNARLRAALLEPAWNGLAQDPDAPVSVAGEASRLIRAFTAVEDDSTRGRVAIAIWHESLYNPEIAHLIVGMIEQITDSLARRLGYLCSINRTSADLDPHSAARVLIAILPGYLLQTLWFPELQAGRFVAAASALLKYRTPESRPPESRTVSSP